MFVTPELLQISSQFILLISNNNCPVALHSHIKKFLEMVENRGVFDLPHSFLITHSAFVVLYERLAKAKRLGLVICMGGGTRCSAVAYNHKGAGGCPGFTFLPLSGQELQSSNAG